MYNTADGSTADAADEGFIFVKFKKLTDPSR